MYIQCCKCRAISCIQEHYLRFINFVIGSLTSGSASQRPNTNSTRRGLHGRGVGSEYAIHRVDRLFENRRHSRLHTRSVPPHPITSQVEGPRLFGFALSLRDLLVSPLVRCPRLAHDLVLRSPRSWSGFHLARRVTPPGPEPQAG